MSLCPVDSYSSYPVLYDLSELIAVLMIVLVPPAIGFMLWRIFVTNRLAPRGGVCVLGLDETSATHIEKYGRGIRWSKLFLHLGTAVVTFKVGLTVFDFYYYLAGLLYTLLE